MDWQKPTWTSSSFLLYTGGLTVLGAALGALGYLSAHYGKGAFVAWALLVLAVLYVIAHAYRRRGHWLTAGVFAFASVVAWALFVGALWNWFGWLDDASRGFPFHGFSVARLGLELLILAAVSDDTRRFRFPFIAAIGVVTAWLFVTDLLSGGGAWSAVVTLLLGVAYAAIGGASGRPTAFWYHLGAGVLIGGSLLYWWHSSDWNWALVCIVALVFIGIGRAASRSTWAVLGAVGLLSASAHFAVEWAGSTNGASLRIGPSPNLLEFHGWVPPVVFAFTGFLLVALGLRGRHDDRL